MYAYSVNVTNTFTTLTLAATPLYPLSQVILFKHNNDVINTPLSPSTPTTIALTYNLNIIQLMVVGIDTNRRRREWGLCQYSPLARRSAL